MGLLEVGDKLTTTAKRVKDMDEGDETTAEEATCAASCIGRFCTLGMLREGNPCVITPILAMDRTRTAHSSAVGHDLGLILVAACKGDSFVHRTLSLMPRVSETWAFEERETQGIAEDPNAKSSMVVDKVDFTAGVTGRVCVAPCAAC